MHHFDSVILERAERVKDDRVRPLIDRTVGHLEVAAWQAPGEPVPPAEAAAQSFSPSRRAAAAPGGEPGVR